MQMLIEKGLGWVRGLGIGVGTGFFGKKKLKAPNVIKKLQKLKIKIKI